MHLINLCLHLDMETKRKRGRPRGEPTKTISVRVPASCYDKLKAMFNELAAKQKTQ